MKIKTIVRGLPVDFDESVNEALENGYLLERREVLPDAVAGFKHYAQLILPDPVPEATDPRDLLRQVRAFCHSQPIEDCHANKCPLAAWCDQIREGCDPSDWNLPDEVTP